MAYRENIVLRSYEKRESAEIVDENSVKYLSQTVNIKRTGKSDKSSQSSNDETEEENDPLFRIIVTKGRKYFLDMKRYYRMSSKKTFTLLGRGQVLIWTI